tara:strand:+ start:2197 stop:2976 length:780 start_codon:yes stop_codon:yes gene_type:complete
MFNLPKNLNEFDVNINKPFSIFEKKNFFDHEFFKKLHNEFPSENYFHSKHDLGNKKYLNNKDKNFFIFLSRSDSWSNFYNAINSKKFLNEIFLLCKKSLFSIEERKRIKRIDFKAKVKRDLLSRAIRKLKNLLGIYEVRIGFEFSLMKNKDYIPPHNDTENKLVSLMVYFPEEHQDKDKNLGTNFFRSTKENYNLWKGDMMNEIESKEFYKNYSIFYTSKFEKNKLVGFLKSSESWHDVSIINTKSNLRKSLNINLYKI